MPHSLDELAGRIIARLAGLPPSGRVIVGIAGMPGAGKSTLAEQLVTRLDARLRAEPLGAGLGADPAGPGTDAVAHVPMDGFHLADVELDRLGLRARKGAPETFDAAGYVALLRRLRENADDVVYAPGFDRTLEQPIAGSIPVPRRARIVVTEGNYLLLDGPWAPVRPLLDEVWFCRQDEATRLRLLLARHVRFGKSPRDAQAWMERTDQSNAELVAVSMHRADLIIDLPRPPSTARITPPAPAMGA
jgi:pantothenate kinase